jgi:predicted permease
LAADYRPGTPPAMMISSRLWHERFGTDPAIVGTTIRLDGEDRLVRGVLPARFRIPGGEADTVLPLRWSAGAADDRSASYLGAIGRLRPGVSARAARAELAAVAARLAHDHPDADEGLGAHVQPLDQMFTAAVRGPLALLIAAAVLLLVVAGLDLAGLDVVRALDRRREVAVRLALGAPRRRLVREAVHEAVLVALGGWLVGLAIARVALAVLPTIQGAYLPASVAIDLTPGVVLLAAAVATGGAIVPALVAARVALRGRGVPVAPWLDRGAERRSAGLPGWLPTLQVAISCTVLACAGLLVRSSLALGAVEPGTAPEEVVTFELSLPEASYGELGAAQDLFDRLAERLRRRGDVEAVAAAHALPPEGGWGFVATTDGMAGADPADEVNLDWQVVAGDYFAALGVPLLRGRLFDQRDGPGAPPVAVLDADASRRLFGTRDPLGRRVRFNDRWHEVVGVVAAQPTVDPFGQPTLYVAHRQEPLPGSFLRHLAVAVRVREAPDALLADVRREVAALDPALAAARVERLDRRMASSLRRVRGRYHAGLMSAFGLLALILAAVGVFALQAFQVRRRTREIGIRMAVGARVAQVVRLVLGRGLRIAAAGAALGILGALSVSRLLERLLYGVEPIDPATLLAVAGLLAASVLLASAIPAARAARVDPTLALDSE